ncbi:MAG: hypothetical protein M5U09_04320 [Gammaproteobacteria bacterium]|nr:hypothetical protein [Gammaproteobacteria bacterium]
MNVTIAGGRIFDGRGAERVADVHVADRHIVAVGQAPAGFVADEVFDARGMVVAPGLIDTQAPARAR